MTEKPSGSPIILRDVTCRAPVNIAVVKYWGKRDEELHLPVHGSLSVTLDHAHLSATTRVRLSRDFGEDEIFVDGAKAPLNNRVIACLNEIRRRARKRSSTNPLPLNGSVDPLPLLGSSVRALVESRNNFPTAAGLASSAAGYACLVYALAKAFGVEGEISDVARRGSGSACRSVYGGFVEWDPGFDGAPSIAKQLFPSTHWPTLRVCIVVVSAVRKSTPSSEGMKRCVETSSLLRHRAEVVVPESLKKLRAAIAARDFASFAEATMKESNSLHATCLDSYPPISYLTEASMKIIQLVHAVNSLAGRPVLCYTFDAGPNSCLFFLSHHAKRLLHFLCDSLGIQLEDPDRVRGMDAKQFAAEDDDDDLPDLTHLRLDEDDRPAVKFLVLTRPGPGPTLVEEGR